MVLAHTTLETLDRLHVVLQEPILHPCGRVVQPKPAPMLAPTDPRHHDPLEHGDIV